MNIWWWIENVHVWSMLAYQIIAIFGILYQHQMPVVFGNPKHPQENVVVIVYQRIIHIKYHQSIDCLIILLLIHLLMIHHHINHGYWNNNNNNSRSHQLSMMNRWLKISSKYRHDFIFIVVYDDDDDDRNPITNYRWMQP